MAQWMITPTRFCSPFGQCDALCTCYQDWDFASHSNFQKLKRSKCFYYFLTNPELDSSYERIDLDDRLTPVSDDLKFYYGQTGLTGFADPDDVSGSGQDCSAKIFNALKHCYRQPTIPTTVNYNNKGSYFLKKWANLGFFLFVFILFSFQFQQGQDWS